MTKEYPIIYTTESVKAYLEDRKTMTRRTKGLVRFNAPSKLENRGTTPPLIKEKKS